MILAGKKNFVCLRHFIQGVNSLTLAKLNCSYNFYQAFPYFPVIVNKDSALNFQSGGWGAGLSIS